VTGGIIAMVTSGLGTGGSELQFSQLVVGLRDRGWSVSVVSLQPGGCYRATLEDGGVPVTVAEVGRLCSPRDLERLRRAVERCRPDLVHTQAFRANLWGRLAAVSLRLPVIASIRATYSYLPALYYPVERWLSRRTSAVVTPSVATARHLVTAVGLSAGRVVTIPNGVDTDLFTPARDGSGFRSAWGLAGRLVVLAPGRLAPQKDPALLLGAFRRLVERHPDAALVFAGTGPLERTMREQAGPLGRAVRFVGELERRSMADAVAAADVICLASRFEGSPNVLLEAMAAGRPVAATAVDGVPEIVSDRVEGLLAPPGDESALAGALLCLAGSPELRRRLGHAGRSRAVAEHSIQANVASHCRLYRAVLNGAAPAA
jgi:glycosyltransferase involved in cell wall biosynthesis